MWSDVKFIGLNIGYVEYQGKGQKLNIASGHLWTPPKNKSKISIINRYDK